MIFDSYLKEVAKALNGESYSVVANGLVSTDEVSVSPGTTVIPGEAGSRFSLNRSRIGNVVSFEGIRSGAAVTSSEGDVLKAFSSVVSSAVGSTGDLGWGFVLPNLVQTTNFDLSFVSSIRVRRA